MMEPIQECQISTQHTLVLIKTIPAYGEPNRRRNERTRNERYPGLWGHRYSTTYYLWSMLLLLLFFSGSPLAKKRGREITIRLRVPSNMTWTFCGFQTVACFVYIELIATLTKSFQSFVVTVTLAAAVLLESLLFLWYIYTVSHIEMFFSKR